MLLLQGDATSTIFGEAAAHEIADAVEPALLQQVQLPDCGVAPLLECPDVTLAAIVDWLAHARVRPPARPR